MRYPFQARPLRSDLARLPSRPEPTYSFLHEGHSSMKCSRKLCARLRSKKASRRNPRPRNPGKNVDVHSGPQVAPWPERPKNYGKVSWYRLTSERDDSPTPVGQETVKLTRQETIERRTVLNIVPLEPAFQPFPLPAWHGIKMLRCHLPISLKDRILS